jgi:hypothetical protein
MVVYKNGWHGIVGINQRLVFYFQAAFNKHPAICYCGLKVEFKSTFFFGIKTELFALIIMLRKNSLGLYSY